MKEILKHLFRLHFRLRHIIERPEGQVQIDMVHGIPEYDLTPSDVCSGHRAVCKTFTEIIGRLTPEAREFAETCIGDINTNWHKFEAHLHKHMLPKDLEETDKLKEAFNSAVYFQNAQIGGDAEFREKSRDFALDYDRQPKTTKPFALVHEYVKRVRAECPNIQTLADNYLHEIEGKLTRVQVGANIDPADLDYKMVVMQLSKLITKKSERAGASAFALQICSTSGCAKGSPQNCMRCDETFGELALDLCAAISEESENEAYASDQYEIISGFREKDGVKQQLANCYSCGGECPKDHPLGKCDKTCNQCGIAFCPATKNKVLGTKAICPVMQKTPITKDSDLRNAAGKQLPERMKLKLGSAQTIKLAGRELPPFKPERARPPFAYGRTRASISMTQITNDDFVLEKHDDDDEVCDLVGGSMSTGEPKPSSINAIRLPATHDSYGFDACATTSSDSLPLDPKTMGVWIEFLCDSGAACTASNKLADMSRYAAPGDVTNKKMSIGGIGKGSTSEAGQTVKCTMHMGSKSTVPLGRMIVSTSIAHSVINQNGLYNIFNIFCDCRTGAIQFPVSRGGETVQCYTKIDKNDPRMYVKVFFPVIRDDVPAQVEEITFEEYLRLHAVDCKRAEHLRENHSAKIMAVMENYSIDDMSAEIYDISKGFIDELCGVNATTPKLVESEPIDEICNADIFYAICNIEPKAFADSNCDGKPVCVQEDATLECIAENAQLLVIDSQTQTAGECSKTTTAVAPPWSNETIEIAISTANQHLVNALRYSVSGEGLKRFYRRQNLNPRGMTAEMLRVIDANIPLKISLMRREPAGRSVDRNNYNLGEMWQFDGSGPYQQKSIVDNGIYAMHASEYKCGFGFVKSTQEHTGTQWLQFISHVVRTARSQGHVVLYVRFDRAGEFSYEFLATVETVLDVITQLAPSKFHEGVGLQERTNDMLNRGQERLLGVGQKKGDIRYVMPARVLAQHLHNITAARGQTKSRYSFFYGHEYDHAKHPVFIFACQVIEYKERDDRGPHGGLNGDRATMGEWLGREGSSHIVRRFNTGKIVYPKHVRSLNEVELVRNALPPATAVHSIPTQTDDPTLTISKTPMATPQPAPPPPAIPSIKAYDPGQRLSIQYRMSDGSVQWFECVIKEVDTSGKQPIYDVHWDDDSFNTDPKWKKFKRLNLYDPTSPMHKPIKQVPSSALPTPAATPTGTEMRPLFLCGGSVDVVDNTQKRVELRYPLAKTTTIDPKNRLDGHDPALADLTVRSNRARISRDISEGKYTFVKLDPMCATFSYRSDTQYRNKKFVLGIPHLSAEAKLVLERHNTVHKFFDEVIRKCEEMDIPWLLECSPDRTTPGSPAYWKEMDDKGYVSYFDRKYMIELVKDKGCKRFLIARCATEDPPTYQKYYEVLACKRLIPLCEQFLSDLVCLHARHPDVIGGKDKDGFWKSQQSEEYTPYMADRFAEVITRSHLQPGETPAPIPPFSSTPRTPTPPAFASRPPPQISSLLPGESPLELAVLEYDGPMTPEFIAASDLALEAAAFHHIAHAPSSTALFACDIRTLFEFEALKDDDDARTPKIASAQSILDDDAAYTDNKPCSQDADKIDAAPLDIMHIAMAIKLRAELQEGRTLTRKELHRMLSDDGLNVSLSQVKKYDFRGIEKTDNVAHTEHCLMRSTQCAIAAARDCLHIAKANQNEVGVETKMGTRIFKVPATAKQVAESNESPFWVEADRKAMDCILVNGNCKVRIDEVPHGTPIAPCVTARKLKIDPATAEIDKYKSRHAVDGRRLEAQRIKRGLAPSPTGGCNNADDLTVKMLIAHAHKHKRRFKKADIGNAYIKGKRRERECTYMYMPTTIKEYDADGTEMVIKLITPLWGEKSAGFEWDAELHERLLSFGWRTCAGLPSMYYFNTVDGDCRLVKIVDDLGFSDSSPNAAITDRTVEMLRAAYDGDVTFDEDPTSFVGYAVNLTEDYLKLSQEVKIVDSLRKYLPHLIDATSSDLLQGKKLDELLDDLKLPPAAERTSKLNAEQKRVQQILGDLKWIERCTMPALTRRVHRLSCIMSFPPPGTLALAEAVLFGAYLLRHQGLIFADHQVPQRAVEDGRSNIDMAAGAPEHLEVTADAATLVGKEVYSVLMTYHGASVLHVVKKAGCVVTSTYDLENFATIKASEYAILGQRILDALNNGHSLQPVVIYTDNLANQRVTTNAQASSRSKYFLIRQTILHERIANGDIKTIHIPDPDNPSDYLTKTVPEPKTLASDKYATGNVGRFSTPTTTA